LTFLSCASAVLGALGFVCAFILSPILIARVLNPGGRMARIGASCLSCIFINTAVPAAMHWIGMPISRLWLGLIHISLACLLGLVSLVIKRPAASGSADNDEIRWMLSAATCLAFVLFPFTRLAGIDTYKWQCLASNVRLAGSIPWLVHPISLLGFTPRAYPSAQPLTLASAQMMGGLGVDTGFYVVSLLTALTGLSGSLLMGRVFMGAERDARRVALFYVFSPVFLRYAHWATGRGFFMAVFPFVLVGAAGLPRARSFALLAVSSCLLLLSHKTALVTLPVLATCIPAVLLVRPGWTPRWMAAGCAAAGTAALLLSGPLFLPGIAGRAIGAAALSASRFGAMLPPAIFLLLAAGSLPSAHRSIRATLPAAVFFLTLSHDSDMYAALPATAFVSLAAAAGLRSFETFSLTKRFGRHFAVAVFAFAVVCTALVIGRRSLLATTRSEYRAAQVIEKLDPSGPMLIEAPGWARRHIHGYVSGCPRFTVTAGSGTLQLEPPPGMAASPSATVRQWIAWARDFVSVKDVAVDWYGSPAVTYWVRIRGEGHAPPDATLIHRDNEIEVWRKTREPELNTEPDRP